MIEHRLYEKRQGTVECVVCGLTPEGHDPPRIEECAGEYVDEHGAKPSVEVPA